MYILPDYSSSTQIFLFEGSGYHQVELKKAKNVAAEQWNLEFGSNREITKTTPILNPSEKVSFQIKLMK